LRGAWGFLAVAIGALSAGCGEPSFGEMPGLCAEGGGCPEGYDCIHGVCALPGTPVPITVGSIQYLRGTDIRMVPQGSGVLVAWELYAYSEEGQKFVGVRVSPEGVVSPRMDLVAPFVAEEDSLEPYFDVLPVDGDRVLVAISAPPLGDDTSVEPRLVTYRVDLPPAGREADPSKFEAAWDKEQRLSTVGYGAVSYPKLVKRSDHVELGYVRSKTDVVDGNLETIAELAVFSLNTDGSLRAPDPLSFRARDGLTVAVGVVDAFRFDAGTWWILDNERPSAMYLPDVGAGGEVKLGRLAVPVGASASTLTYVEPSPRVGDKLPTDPVAGPAELRAIGTPASGAIDTKIGPLPTLRDTPRPAWIVREGEPSILVTPGEAIDAPELSVHLVDTSTGSATLSAKIPRLSTRALGAVHAELVAGKLFVCWFEEDEAVGKIRMAILPEPR